MNHRNLIRLTLIVALTSGTAHALDCKPPSASRLIASGNIYSYDLSTVVNIASEIRIEESLWSDFHTLVRSTAWHRGMPQPTFVHFTAEPRALFYRVSAFDSSNPSFGGCTWSDRVTIMPNLDVQRMFRRSIVPIAGSLTGANNSRFRTSLLLLNPQLATLAGRIVFHPMQTTGTASDPSVHYRLAPGEHIEYDDVVAAIGATGLGSLDVVPDDDSFAYLPAVQVTVYNDAGNGATFGMLVPQIRAGDVEANVGPLDLVVPDGIRKRLNVGVRTGGEGGRINATLRRSDGTSMEVEREFPSDYLTHGTLADLLGASVSAGDSVRIYATNAVAYATLTNNVTNDPVMLIPFANAADHDVAYFW